MGRFGKFGSMALQRRRKGRADAAQVGTHCLGHAQLQRVTDQGVPDGDFLHTGDTTQEGLQVVAVQVMSSVNLQTTGQGGLRGGGKARYLCGLLGRSEGLRKRLGVKLDTIGADVAPAPWRRGRRP